MPKRNQCLFLLLLLSIISGCDQSVTPPPDAEVPTAGDAVEIDEPQPIEPAPAGQMEENGDAAPPNQGTTQTGPNDDAAVTVEIKSWEETQALVSEARGKVVVMDIWATYCIPCLKEFPNLVQLHQKHSDEVTCISVSLDFQGFDDETPQDYIEPVLEVLKAKNATFQNVLCSTPSETVYNEKMSQNSIPVVFVFDQQGQLAAEFPNPQAPAEFTYQEDILPLVQKLINEN